MLLLAWPHGGSLFLVQNKYDHLSFIRLWFQTSHNTSSLAWDGSHLLFCTLTNSSYSLSPVDLKFRQAILTHLGWKIINSFNFYWRVWLSQCGGFWWITIKLLKRQCTWSNVHQTGESPTPNTFICKYWVISTAPPGGKKKWYVSILLAATHAASLMYIHEIWCTYLSKKKKT